MTDARVPLLRELARPSVLIGFPADAAGLTCVDLDFQAGPARACVEHLAGLGHRRIALLGAPAGGLRAGHRLRPPHPGRVPGGRRAARPRRLGPRRARSRCRRSARSLADLLAARPGLTGLVVHNEAAVAPVLTVLAELGRRVPEDVSVVAICPDQVASAPCRR